MVYLLLVGTVLGVLGAFALCIYIYGMLAELDDIIPRR
jgi:hypothetical protein